MFILSLDTVSENARRLYDAKKLTAQHPDPKQRKCVNNTEDGYRCAVAASYPEDFPQEGSFMAFYEGGQIGCVNPREAIHIQRIQDAHDAWAVVSRESGDEKACSLLEIMFLAQINHPDYSITSKFLFAND